MVFGYLSVLLSTLTLDDGIRARIRAALPGRSLDRLLATVEEFLLYHRRVEEIHDGIATRPTDGNDHDHDAMAGFTGRLQGIVDRIRKAETAE